MTPSNICTERPMYALRYLDPASGQVTTIAIWRDGDPDPVTLALIDEYGHTKKVYGVEGVKIVEVDDKRYRPWPPPYRGDAQHKE